MTTAVIASRSDDILDGALLRQLRAPVSQQHRLAPIQRAKGVERPRLALEIADRDDPVLYASGWSITICSVGSPKGFTQ